jgi:uncharacterized membrane protein YhaH (DUF805 family)
MGLGHQIGQSIRHCLSNVLTFRGRDGLTHFWPYALLVMLLGGMVMMAVMMPMLTRTMAKMQSMARENPDDFIIEQSPTSYNITYVGNDPAVMAQLMPDFSGMITYMGLAMLLPIGLIAAAAARRLHDRGTSGKWLIIPLALLTLSFSIMPGLFADFGTGGDPDFGKFALMFAINFIYIASIAAFLVLFALPGHPGDNRYGPPPLSLT